MHGGVCSPVLNQGKDKFIMSNSRIEDTFNNRISKLIMIFDVDRLAYYLSQDASDIAKWSNSDTLIEAPAHINYSFLLHHYPVFNEQWLTKGIGDMFNSGTEEENIKDIQAKEFKKKLEKDAEKITEELSRKALNK